MPHRAFEHTLNAPGGNPEACMEQPVIHPRAVLMDGAKIVGSVHIAEGSSIWHNAVLRGDCGSITVGARTNIQDCCVVHTDHGGACAIGDDVTIGHACVIHQATVKNGALIGMGTIIMNGAVIGAGCVIGAGSLVTEGKEIPDGSLAFGRPAKVVRALTEEELAHNIAHAAGYVALAAEYEKND